MKDAFGHAVSEGVVLPARLSLLVGLFAAQVSLTGFAMHYLARTGYLESLGDTFMRLSHVELSEKDDV